MHLFDLDKFRGPQRLRTLFSRCFVGAGVGGGVARGSIRTQSMQSKQCWWALVDLLNIFMFLELYEIACDYYPASSETCVFYYVICNVCLRNKTFCIYACLKYAFIVRP